MAWSYTFTICGELDEIHYFMKVITEYNTLEEKAATQSV